MNILTLTLKKEFAREIVAGTKVREYREPSDFYFNKLFDKEVVNEKTIYVEGNHFTPIHFDAIRFYWYTKEYLLVECKGWGLFTINDLKRMPCDEFFGGDGTKSLYRTIKERDEFELKGMLSVDQLIIFQLGKVLENHIDIVK